MMIFKPKTEKGDLLQFEFLLDWYLSCFIICDAIKQIESEVEKFGF